MESSRQVEQKSQLRRIHPKYSQPQKPHAKTNAHTNSEQKPNDANQNATAWTTKPILIFGYDLHGLKLYHPKDQNAPLHENDPTPSLKYNKPHGKVPPTYHTEPDHDKPSWAEPAMQNNLTEPVHKTKTTDRRPGFTYIVTKLAIVKHLLTEG